MDLHATVLVNLNTRSRISRFVVLVAIMVLATFLHPARGKQIAESGAKTVEISRSTPLDGLMFSAGIVRAEEDGKQPLEDTLVFKDGRFSSEVCKRYNFVPAPYWIRQEDDQVHFLTELTSPTDGKMVWQGTVRDGMLEGTMRWTRKRWYWTIDVEHNIRGEVKEVPVQGFTD